MSGFYKAHASALFFLSTVILFYFFFIGILDKMPDDQKLSWNLVFARLMIHDWWMVGLFSFMSLLYVLKSAQYILTEIQKDKNLIVKYASQCFRTGSLFFVWLKISFLIMLPLFIYGLFVSVVGLMIAFSFKAIFLLLWLIILVICSSVIYIRTLKTTSSVSKWNYINLRLFRRRSLGSLYLWYVIDKLKVLFLLTKIVSWLLILGTFVSTDFGVASSNYNYFVASIIALTNSLIVFKEYQFNTNYLYWSFNFPKSKTSFFLSGIVNYVFFLLPELLWILTYFRLGQAIGLIIWMFSIIMLYRGLLFELGANMKSYFKYVFFIFILLYFISLYNVSLFVVPILIGLSYYLFSKNFPLKMVEN